MIPFQPTAAAKVSPTAATAAGSAPASRPGFVPFTASTPLAPAAPTPAAPPTLTPDGVQLNPGTSLGANLKSLPGAILGAGKAAFSSLTAGAPAIGESLGTAALNIGRLAQGKNPDIPVDIGKTIGGYLAAGSTVAGLGLGGAPVAAAAKEGAGAALAATKTATNAAPALTKSFLLGKEGISTLAKIANPEAKAFVPKAQGGLGQTFSTVADGVQKAVDSFISQSKATLQAVKQQIPKNITIPAEKIATAVNDGILQSVKSSATYHGVEGDVSSIFKTPDALIHSGILNSDEVARVKGMVDVVKNWTDTSARGVLNLKESLAPFYKPGLDASNHVLTSIQTNLKNVVGDVYPAIKPALATASKNIDKADEFTRHLLGSNETTGESKLIQLAKNLNNPALKGYQHALLDDLKTATGHDALPKLKGYADYLDLLKPDFPSKWQSILKATATGPAAKVVGGVAGAGFLSEGLKRVGL